LAERADALEAQMAALQDRLAELVHAQQQLAAQHGQLLEGAQLLEVLGRATTDLKDLVDSLQERTGELERGSADAQKTVDDVLNAIAGQNEVARASRRETLDTQGELAQTLARLEARLDALAPPARRSAKGS
jgi:chromosome segregation ATPase